MAIAAEPNTLIAIFGLCTATQFKILRVVVISFLISMVGVEIGCISARYGGVAFNLIPI